MSFSFLFIWIRWLSYVNIFQCIVICWQSRVRCSSRIFKNNSSAKCVQLQRKIAGSLYFFYGVNNIDKYSNVIHLSFEKYWPSKNVTLISKISLMVNVHIWKIWKKLEMQEKNTNCHGTTANWFNRVCAMWMWLGAILDADIAKITVTSAICRQLSRHDWFMQKIAS